MIRTAETRIDKVVNLLEQRFVEIDLYHPCNNCGSFLFADTAVTVP